MIKLNIASDFSQSRATSLQYFNFQQWILIERIFSFFGAKLLFLERQIIYCKPVIIKTALLILLTLVFLKDI